MLDKRIAALFFIILCLVVSVPVFSAREGQTVMGLVLADESELRSRYGDDKIVAMAGNASDILLFEGCTIPYDKASGIFYVSQNMNNSSFYGIFSTKYDNTVAYLIKDGYEAEKQAGIREGHIYRIWLEDGVRATICNVIFTGLPVVSVYSELSAQDRKGDAVDGITTYEKGEIDVWSPSDEDLGGCWTGIVSCCARKVHQEKLSHVS